MVLRIGHRGACGYETENTLKSIKKAIELNVDAVEFDVRMCKTGEIVVVHDRKLHRVTNGNGQVSKKTLNELKSLDINGGEKIPTLVEVLDFIEGLCNSMKRPKKIILDIELKSTPTAKAVYKIIEDYVGEKGWGYENFLITSFNRSALKKFSKLNNFVKIGVLTMKTPNGRICKFARKIKAYSVQPRYYLVNKKVVKKIHENDLRVITWTWTENNKKAIDRVKNLGVDGIISPYPDLVDD